MRRVTRRIAALARFLHIDPSVSGSFGMKRRTVDSAVAADSGSEEIPVLHRLAIIYLMLPVVIWLVGWHQWWVGVPAVAAIILASRHALSGSWKVSLSPFTVFLLVVALAWVMMTAAGGIFDVHNFDWTKHRAILLDLSRGAWPVYLPTWAFRLSVFFPGEVEYPTSLLRFYLGYYMVPGMLGKWFGVAALNWAVPLWTWAGVALILLMFTRGICGWKVVVAALMFIFFSGMDVLTRVLFEGWEWFEPSFAWNGWPWISLGPVDMGVNPHWHLDIKYLSHMAGLIWAPQHFIAGGLYALLLIQLRRHGRFLAVSGVVVGSCLFWSPFVAVGLLPLVVVLLIENGIRPFLRWQNLFLALPVVVLILTYLSSGSEGIRRNWLWENTALDYVVRSLPAFYLIEFLLLATLLVLLRPKLLREPFFAACLLTLLLLPWYSFGRYNDLVMRGLIPALVLLSYFTARSIFCHWPDAIQRGWDTRRVVLSILIAVVLSIGAFGGVVNLTRANNDHDFGVFRYTQFGLDYTISNAVPGSIHHQYRTKHIPDWYGSLLRENHVAQVPAKRELIVRSRFDVYLLDGGIVAFVRSPCAQDDMDAKFILHAYPLVMKDRMHDTLDFTLNEGVGLWDGETCVTAPARALPAYAIGRMTVGQYNQARTSHSWIRSYYSWEYVDRLIREAGEPIIRSSFDVYINEDRLVYSKALCSEEDVAASFFLRVFPVDASDLSDDRKQEGFENINFTFSDHGGWIGEGCFLVHDLPDYAVLKISTGQYLPGGGKLWEGAATLGE